jgi:N-acetylmuramoyl-L-alanine amidase
MREIKYLVVHISDSPKDRGDGAEDIHRWHQERGWDGIGYNAVINGEAALEPGRPDYWQGAHVRDFDADGEGDNSDSLGICIITDTAPDEDQLRTLEGWIHSKLIDHPNAEVVGHRDLDSRKTCPNMDIPAWWASRKKYLID